jgi:hypothetical protein
MRSKEEPKAASIALQTELEAEQEALKRAEGALTRTMGSSEREQIRVSIGLCEVKIRDLKRQIARVGK